MRSSLAGLNGCFCIDCFLDDFFSTREIGFVGDTGGLSNIFNSSLFSSIGWPSKLSGGRDPLLQQLPSATLVSALETVPMVELVSVVELASLGELEPFVELRSSGLGQPQLVWRGKAASTLLHPQRAPGK